MCMVVVKTNLGYLNRSKKFFDWGRPPSKYAHGCAQQKSTCWAFYSLCQIVSHARRVCFRFLRPEHKILNSWCKRSPSLFHPFHVGTRATRYVSSWHDKSWRVERNRIWEDAWSGLKPSGVNPRTGPILLFLEIMCMKSSLECIHA